MGNLESPITIHVLGLWEETGVPGENMQTSYRKAPSQPVDLNLGSSCCEVIVLTITQLCHPSYCDTLIYFHAFHYELYFI